MHEVTWRCEVEKGENGVGSKNQRIKESLSKHARSVGECGRRTVTFEVKTACTSVVIRTQNREKITGTTNIVA